MNTTIEKLQIANYRNDIDGLRAVAVLSVLFFHLGYLPNGYLGVDVFFGISGYLITKKIQTETLEHRFSITQFYIGRIRRIVPLVLVTTLTALLIGLFVMLPDDFENLSQSVFATNLFANNILQFITTGNYWDVVNAYKPLMHTWSLGVEEQFYIVYPLLFLIFIKRSKLIPVVLLILTLLSLGLFLCTSNEASKFYLIQFRFFELALGGLAAIVFKDKPWSSRYTIILPFILLTLLLVDLHLPDHLKLIFVVISTVCLLIAENKSSAWLLENIVLTGIGKISFSFYMWHQIVLAYVRYFITDKIGLFESSLIILTILILSLLSFFLIEQPFRDKSRVSTKLLLISTTSLLVIICSASYFFYTISGIVRNVPELGVYTSDHKKNTGMSDTPVHEAYNSKIQQLNNSFTPNGKTKILIIGNSFARDFANILLESNLKSKIEISYVRRINDCPDINERFKLANYVFFSELEMSQLIALKRKFQLDTSKAWNVGPKNFGSNNGLFYNKRRHKDYCIQRTFMTAGFYETNYSLKNQWGHKYIDLISLVIDKEGKIPVFTPDCKFISQDCRHLTQAGAAYYAQLMEWNEIFTLP